MLRARSTIDRKVNLLVSLPLLVILLAASGAGAEGDPSDLSVEVLRPRRDRVDVGSHLAVEGTASLPPGHHLWVFARRVDFEPFWWPQNRGQIDAATGRWKVQATIGAPRDIGWDFDIAVVVVEGCAHAELEKYRREAMLTERRLPIEMPELAALPELFRVKKVSHATQSKPATGWRPPDKTADIVLEVAHPRSDAIDEVKALLTVEGTASLPPRHHLWVFARRVDFDPLWWPQKEGMIDPQGRWRVDATIGDPVDVGWQFDVAVAVLGESHHIRLLAYRREAQRTGIWLPIEMPKAVAAPRLLRVLKVRHE